MTRALVVAPVCALVFVTSIAACSSSGGDAPAKAAADDQDAGVYIPPPATPPPPTDPLDPHYPTAHAPMNTIDYHGGRILQSPQIVTVTFQNDPLEERIELFDDTITATPWWTAATSEYCNKAGVCVGAGTSGGHVVIPADASPTYTDSSRNQTSTIQDFIKAKVADGTFPAPTSETIYALYFQTGVKITLDGQSSCRSFGAYHNTVTVAPPGSPEGTPGIPVAYAVMPRCQGGEPTLTVSASHEFAEAATDPDIGINHIAFYMDDPVWAPAGGETGDLCVDFGTGDDTWQESGFTVQPDPDHREFVASIAL